MRVDFVVLYVQDPDLCRSFWLDQLGMVEKARIPAGAVSVVTVGFADQPFGFQLVPLSLMGENPDGLTLGPPSICFRVSEPLAQTHARLTAANIPVSPIGDHGGVSSFGFSDPEGRWFAVMAD